MTATKTRLARISYPDVLGFEWDSTYSEFPGQTYRHSITWPRGTTSVYYGTRVDREGEAPGRWVNTPIVNPERLGFDGTPDGVLKVAEALYSDEGGDE